MKRKINEGELRLDYIDSPLLYLGELNSAGQRHGKGLNINVHGKFRTYGEYKNGKDMVGSQDIGVESWTVVDMPLMGMSFIMNFTNYCTITSKTPSITVE